jgi:uncharacterized membrane protein YgdD (TMEM256/DUF423 family)
MPPLGSVHAALSCVNTAAGQAVCSGTSTGFLAGLGVLLFVYLALAVLGIVAAVKVVTKAGYSGWWVLIGIVPFVGSIFVLIFAFSTWPVTREVQILRAQLAGAGGYGRPGGLGGGSLASGPRPGPTAPNPFVPDPTIPAATEPSAQPGPIPSFGQFLHGGPAAAPTDPPAGWYPSPGGEPGQMRYWNGTGWTGQYR